MITISNKDRVGEDVISGVHINHKGLYGTGAVVLLLSVCLGLLCLLPLQGKAFMAAKGLQLLLFILPGLYLVRARENKMLSLTNGGSDRRLLFAVGLTLVVSVVLLVLYILVNPALLFMSVASAAVLFLPFVIIEQWSLMQQIPEEVFPPWQLPVGAVSRRASISLNSLRIKLKISASYFDPVQQEIDVIVPGRDQTGKVLLAALDLQNGNGDAGIQLLDETGKPYAWEFFHEKSRVGGVRPLNPATTLLGNKLRDHSVIIAKRVKQTLLTYAPNF